MEIVRITYLWKKAVATTQKYILQIRENIQLKALAIGNFQNISN